MIAGSDLAKRTIWEHWLELTDTRQLLAMLPAIAPGIRQAAREAYQRFAANPAHPSLHFHRMQWDPRYGSARVTREYRAVGILQGNTVTWVWIGNHEDYDRLFPK